VPHDDGSDWTEISADPPRDREGRTDKRLFTTLEATSADTSSQRSVTCPAWLQAAQDATLRARGTISVTLQSDGGELHTVRHNVDLELDAGSPSTVFEWGAPIVVDAANGDMVTCTVRFNPS
jgi:hypothetical protein